MQEHLRNGEEPSYSCVVRYVSTWVSEGMFDPSLCFQQSASTKWTAEFKADTREQWLSRSLSQETISQQIAGEFSWSSSHLETTESFSSRMIKQIQ